MHLFTDINGTVHDTSCGSPDCYGWYFDLVRADFDFRAHGHDTAWMTDADIFCKCLWGDQFVYYASFQCCYCNGACGG